MEEPTKMEEIFFRLQQGASVKSLTDLARALGVAQQSVFNARARGKIPDAWFRKIADLNNISIDWLLYGEGAMHRGEKAQNLSPANLELDQQILLDVVETLEEFLQGSKKNLPPKAKAELVYQLYRLVMLGEADVKQQPLHMFRLIQSAMTANE